MNERRQPIDPAARTSGFRKPLQSIAAPSLIIVGDRDIVTPEHAVEMFRTIPGARLCVIPRAGHGVPPQETILTFLQEEATGVR